MLYNLFEYLNENYNLPGAGVFQYISFRAAIALQRRLKGGLHRGKRKNSG